MQLNGFQMQHRKQRLQLTQLMLECNTDTMQQANEKQYQWMQDIQDSTFSVMPPKGTCNRQAKGCIKAMEASCCKGAMQCALHEADLIKAVVYQKALGVGAGSGQVNLQILPEIGAGVLADRFPFACCPIPCVPARHSTMLENIQLIITQDFQDCTRPTLCLLAGIKNLA